MEQRKIPKRKKRKRLNRRPKLVIAGMAAVLFLFVLNRVSALDGKFSATVPKKAEAPAFREEIGEDTVRLRLAQLREEFPSGEYWNHIGQEFPPDGETWRIVTDIPCNHAESGTAECNTYNGVTGKLFPFYGSNIQCLGFSSMLSDQIFGVDAPITVYRDYDKLRLGDQIRLTEEHHSMVVIEKSEENVAVAEVNADYNTCEISWGRQISRETLESYQESVEYFTRYPEEGEKQYGVTEYPPQETAAEAG